MVRSRSRHLKASNEPRRVALVCRIISFRALAAFIAAHLEGDPHRAFTALAADPRIKAVALCSEYREKSPNRGFVRAENMGRMACVSDLSAEIQLRPTRIGFLVHPADLASVRRIMRACTCLWGGVYNPIIPVFNKPPTEWKSEVHERFKGAAVAKGYVRFFEPDVYVEAEAGLLEKAGLGALRQDHSFHSQVIT